MEVSLQTTILKLTAQEQNVVNFLTGKDTVYWEELAQFAKDPQNVKFKTLQKVVSDIRRKYANANLPVPFSCTFKRIDVAPTIVNSLTPLFADISTPKQEFVQMRKTTGGKMVPSTDTRSDAQIDFTLDPHYNVVISRTRGRVKLSEAEFEIFELLYRNAGKPVSIDDIRRVRFPSGSLCPPTWADQIASTLTKLRKNLPELKEQNRLCRIQAATSMTSYMLI